MTLDFGGRVQDPPIRVISLPNPLIRSYFLKKDKSKSANGSTGNIMIIIMILSMILVMIMIMIIIRKLPERQVSHSSNFTRKRNYVQFSYHFLFRPRWAIKTNENIVKVLRDNRHYFIGDDAIKYYIRDSDLWQSYKRRTITNLLNSVGKGRVALGQKDMSEPLSRAVDFGEANRYLGKERRSV